MRKSRIVLMVCFSILFLLLTGCTHTSFNAKWTLPHQPQTVEVEFYEQGDGYFIIDSANATNLANNVDELKAYIDKLEVLIENMQKYYK